MRQQCLNGCQEHSKQVLRAKFFRGGHGVHREVNRAFKNARQEKGWIGRACRGEVARHASAGRVQRERRAEKRRRQKVKKKIRGTDKAEKEAAMFC